LLTPGSRFGVYEIQAAIGAGGMGEVYRARDTKLYRDVAIKTLPDAFAHDTDRVARFKREAQTLAALNHPHIAQIYGVIEEPRDGSHVHALVMELVEGEDLSWHIGRGAMALADALPIAKQIVDALEAAHEQGIVHRDLKPANVKLRSDGTVKVLDFGLAKALDAAGTSGTGEAANSPTLTARATQMGMIIGTAAYMAPEQARGKAVDKRADIWAFGVVLYEMLTGGRAFQGDDVSVTLASVIKEDVDWQALPADLPTSMRHLLQRCLQKDPRRRLRDIGEARIALSEPAEPVVAATSPPAPPAGRVWRLLPWGITALLAVATAVGWWGWWHPPAAPLRTVTRSAMVLPADTDRLVANDVAVSRDGTRMAYWEGGTGKEHIVLRMMDQLEGKPIPGTEDGDYPAFSPDGQWIAFFSFDRSSSVKLRKNPVTGGTSFTLCDLSDLNTEFPNVQWNDDDTLLFGSSTGLRRVPASGGKPEALTTVDTKAGETEHTFPQVLPGGRAILFTIRGTSNATSRLAVFDVKTRQHRVLVTAAQRGRYVPTGHLVFQRGDTLFAAPFDVGRLSVTGSETPVVEGVSLFDYAFSDSGILAFTPGTAEQGGTLTLEWVDRKGVATPLLAEARLWRDLALSPDGRFVAGSIAGSAGGAEAAADIWKYDIARTTLTKLTFEGVNTAPVWAPDGRWVTYQSTRAGKSAIYRVPPDGSGPPQLLLAAEAAEFSRPTSSAPDGTLLYVKAAGGAKPQIWRLPWPAAGRPAGGSGRPEPSGTRTPSRLFETTSAVWDPQVSPDGRWVAYVSDESGGSEVYVMPFALDAAPGTPGPGGKTQISTRGGVGPRWSRNGKELLYRAPDSTLTAVDLTTTPPGRPQPLFAMTHFLYDVTPDPQRMLVSRRGDAGKAGSRSFVVITDWFEDLRRRAPVTR
jgi:serine/threonine-protein kinase